MGRIIERVSDACVVLDRDWNYVFVNAHAASLFNRLPEQLEGKNIWEEFPEGVDQELYRACYQSVETQRFVQLEANFLPLHRWFENRIYPSPDGLMIFFQDVTERRAAERERRQLARVLETTRDLVTVWNVEGGLRFANAAARGLLGIDPRLAAARTLEDLHAPQATKQLREEAIPEATRRGSWLGETVLRRSDGEELPVLASLVYEEPSAGEPGFLALVARDITERKRLEDHARDEARVRAKAEQMAHLGLWEWTIATNQVKWSDELYEIYGLDGKTFDSSFEAYLDRVHPEDRARVRATIEQAIHTRSNVTFDERIVRPDGSIRYLRSWGGIRVGDQGEPLGLIGACLDTTELIKTTTELGRNQEWLRRALEASEIALWDWDITHGSVAWSQGFERLFGVEPGTLAGTYDAYLGLIHPDDRARVDAAVRETIEHGVEYQVPHRVAGSDGSIRWLEGRGRVFSDEHGTRVRMAGSVADVTSRHALEERVLRSQKMEAMGRLAAGVAHDFNNLLTVILTMAEVIGQQASIGQTARVGLEEIVGAAKRAAALTRHLLTLSRQQAPGVAPMELNLIIEASVAMLRRLLPEDVRLLVDLDPGLWSVRGDRGQIEQVLLNLVLNARDALPDGGDIRVTTRNSAPTLAAPGVSTERRGPHVIFSVSDTGTGMTAETRARAFEPFFTTKPAGKGTGLGLSMVYGIVRQMGGTIDIDSAPGRGTTFTVVIPAQPMTASVMAPVVPAAARQGAGETVLLVDDQDAIRRTLGLLLGARGYRVLEASDGASALRVIDSPGTGHVDVLLTDVGMPGMNGVELVQRVRGTHPDIGVVFMSGYAAEPMAEQGDARTASIAKPFTNTELCAVLRTVINGGRGHLTAGSASR